MTVTSRLFNRLPLVSAALRSKKPTSQSSYRLSSSKPRASSNHSIPHSNIVRFASQINPETHLGPDFGFLASYKFGPLQARNSTDSNKTRSEAALRTLKAAQKSLSDQLGIEAIFKERYGGTFKIVTPNDMPGLDFLEEGTNVQITFSNHLNTCTLAILATCASDD